MLDKARPQWERAHSPGAPQDMVRIPGGTFRMGAASYDPCQLYRPAARHAEPVDTSTSHVGFRCVIRERRLP